MFVIEKSRPGIVAAASLVLLAAAPRAWPAEPPRSFTIQSAAEFAVRNYPSTREALERVTAAQAGAGLARTPYLPRLDSLAQINLATHNNITGLVLPQPLIPSISGPVLPSTDAEPVWGSAGALLLSWEPFDFGYRGAALRAARAAEQAASASGEVTKVDVAAAACDAFMALLAARQQALAAQADVDRRDVIARSVRALVQSALRPGADASRAEAELAGARIRRIRAEELVRISQVSFTTALGLAGAEAEIQPGPLLDEPPPAPVPESDIAGHPLVAAEKARVDEARARADAEHREYAPRFNLQSALFGRGSGANPDGTETAGLAGLDRRNWAVGLTVSFPIMDFASSHARQRIEDAQAGAESARYDETMQRLSGLILKSRAEWESARQVAENTPIQLQAARSTESQARARYDAGLGTLVEVAEAERILVQAEIDDSLARLAVWRGLLQMAAAQGDLAPFFEVVRSRTGGGH